MNRRDRIAKVLRTHGGWREKGKGAWTCWCGQALAGTDQPVAMGSYWAHCADMVLAMPGFDDSVDSTKPSYQESLDLLKEL